MWLNLGKAATCRALIRLHCCWLWLRLFSATAALRSLSRTRKLPQKRTGTSNTPRCGRGYSCGHSAKVDIKPSRRVLLLVRASMQFTFKNELTFRYGRRTTTAILPASRPKSTLLNDLWRVNDSQTVVQAQSSTKHYC